MIDCKNARCGEFQNSYFVFRLVRSVHRSDFRIFVNWTPDKWQPWTCAYHACCRCLQRITNKNTMYLYLVIRFKWKMAIIGKWYMHWQRRRCLGFWQYLYAFCGRISRVCRELPTLSRSLLFSWANNSVSRRLSDEVLGRLYCIR